MPIPWIPIATAAGSLLGGLLGGKGRKGHFWSPSYCLLTTGQVSLDVLKTYIEDQSDEKNI